MDKPVDPNAAAPPAAAPQDSAAAPLVAAPVPAETSPVAATPPSGGDTAAPAAPAAAAPDPAAAAAPSPERTPTLLEKFDAEAKAKEDAAKAKAAEKTEKPAEPKPGEAKPDDAAAKSGDKPAEAAKPGEAPAVAPVAYQYMLPDTIKMDDAQRGAVHAALDAFRTDPEKGAQGLIDLHAKLMDDFATAYVAETTRNQFSVFNDTKKGWEKQILADPEVGGSGHQTAMQATARVRDLGVSSAKPGTPRYEQEMKEFNEFLAVTGAGSHPAFVRLLHNLARYVDEPQFSSQPANIKPPPSNGRPPNGRRAVLYDHPSSQTRS